jgi:hypothetical protein
MSDIGYRQQQVGFHEKGSLGCLFLYGRLQLFQILGARVAAAGTGVSGAGAGPSTGAIMAGGLRWAPVPEWRRPVSVRRGPDLVRQLW